MHRYIYVGDQNGMDQYAQGLEIPSEGKPLRNPGQSLDEEIQTLFDLEINSYRLISLCVLFLAGYECLGGM